MRNQNSVKLREFFYVISVNIHYKDGGCFEVQGFPIRILSKERPDMAHNSTRKLVLEIFEESLKERPIFRPLEEGKISLHNDLFDRVVTNIHEPGYDYTGSVYTIDEIYIAGTFNDGNKVRGIYSREEIFKLSKKYTIQLVYDMYKTDEFIPDGYITVANWGGYELMLSDCGSMAKVRDSFGTNSPKVSDWLSIEYIENEEIGECEPIIDYEGYNIRLNEAMLSRF
jgi:hypothetical protein